MCHETPHNHSSQCESKNTGSWIRPNQHMRIRYFVFIYLFYFVRLIYHKHLASGAILGGANSFVNSMAISCSFKSKLPLYALHYTKYHL